MMWLAVAIAAVPPIGAAVIWWALIQETASRPGHKATPEEEALLFLLRLVCLGTFLVTSGIFLNVVGYYCDGNAATVSPNAQDQPPAETPSEPAGPNCRSVASDGSGEL